MRKGFTFDDVCIVPPKSTVPSRSAPKINTYLTKELPLEIPLINSPMDTVISIELGNILASNGTVPIFCRGFANKRLETFDNPFFISIGVSPEIDKIKDLSDKNPRCVGINIDVANGHSTAALEAVEKIKKEFPELNIMAGAVCTRQGYIDLVNSGADCVRVGIGNGAACLTRIVTGVGVPQFTALQDILPARQILKIPVISDGGMRTSGDIVKALGAGADIIMIGNLFSRTHESGAKKRTRRGVEECFYRGQASADYQKAHYGKVNTVPEGESAWVPVIGSAKQLIEDLCTGLRQGMAMLDSMSLKELREKVKFMEVTGTYLEESRARIK